MNAKLSLQYSQLLTMYLQGPGNFPTGGVVIWTCSKAADSHTTTMDAATISTPTLSILAIFVFNPEIKQLAPPSDPTKVLVTFPDHGVGSGNELKTINNNDQVYSNGRNELLA